MSDAVYNYCFFCNVTGIWSGWIKWNLFKGSKITSSLWNTYQNQPPYLCVLPCLDSPMSDHEENIKKKKKKYPAYQHSLNPFSGLRCPESFMKIPPTPWLHRGSQMYPVTLTVAILSSKFVLLTSWLVFAGFGFWTVKNEFLKTMFSLYCRGNAELI